MTPSAKLKAKTFGTAAEAGSDEGREPRSDKPDSGMTSEGIAWRGKPEKRRNSRNSRFW